MKIDPSKSALQNLLALIDASNPSAPNLPNEVTVSNLQSGTYANGADTKITLTGAGPQGNYANFTGSVDVTYKRLTLAAETASPTGTLAVSRASSLAAALLAIENYYGFIPGEITAPGLTIPASSGNGSVTLQSSGSYVYEDGSTSVTVNWTQPLTNLLVHADAIPFTDDGGATLTNSAVTLSTAAKKFGAGSAAFNGAAALTFSNSLMNFQAGDFTLEAWINPSVVDAAQRGIICCSWGLQLYSSGGGLALYASNSASTGSYFINGLGTAAGTIVANTWQHVALVRSGNVWTIYINGVAKASITASNALPTPVYAASIGAVVVAAGSELYFNGDIDEVRISRVARYTSNFTPSAAPFTMD
jgi:hypothetical protein